MYYILPMLNTSYNWNWNVQTIIMIIKLFKIRIYELFSSPVSTMWQLILVSVKSPHTLIYKGFSNEKSDSLKFCFYCI